jgi:hypothetical protein
MRFAVLCVVGLAGCTQIFGLDSPMKMIDAAGNSDGSGADAGHSCRGDTFDDNILDDNFWVTFVEGMENVVEMKQQLHVTLDDATGSAYSGLDTRLALRASDIGVQVEVVQATENNATETALAMYRTGGDQLILSKDNGVVRATVKTGGVNSSQQLMWDPDVHKFFRIERSNGAVQFWTSANGTTWTSLWTTTASFAQESLTATIYAGHYMTARAHTVVFDNFKILDGTCTP